jgi:hypothetical protein
LKAWKLIMCAIAVAATLPANEFSVGSQPPSYWFDEQSRSIRPLVGPGGAARLDDPVISEIDFASVSPTGLAAIVRRDEEWAWIDKLDGAQTSLAIAMPTEPLMIRWAGQAPCAAVYSEPTQTVWKICAGGDAVQQSGPLYLGAGFAGLDSMEMSGDGSSLIGIASSEAGATLLYARDLSGWIVVDQLPAGGAAVFRRQSHSLLVADRARGQLREMPLRSGWPAWNGRTVELAEIEGDLVAILEGGSRDLVAVLDEGMQASLYSLESGLLRKQPLDAQLSRPIPLDQGRYLAAPVDPRGTLQLFDMNREEIVFFVPQTR